MLQLLSTTTSTCTFTTIMHRLQAMQSMVVSRCLATFMLITIHLLAMVLGIHDVLNIELNAKSVSSDPFQVRPHEDVQHVTSKLFRQGYPGELLRIPVVAVGLNKWSCFCCDSRVFH